MRVLVTGATGNVGTAVVEALTGEPGVEEVIGVARRVPDWRPDGVRWVRADVASADLEAEMRGVAAVVHLAWAIQPSHRHAALTRTNVAGSERVFRAAARAGVPALIHASSIGAYSPAPGRVVEEGWPTGGVRQSGYSRDKVAAERLLDRLVRDVPAMRVVRMRPALTGQARAGAGLRRLFAGPLLPSWLLAPGRMPAVPDPGVRLQLVHAADVADAYRRAVLADVSGALNLAADPPLDAGALARVLRSRTLRVPAVAIRAATDLSWRLHLQPTPAGWVDLARRAPLLDASRARRELGWEPLRHPEHVLRDILTGVREGEGRPTPPLAPSRGVADRAREAATGAGERSW